MRGLVRFGSAGLLLALVVGCGSDEATRRVARLELDLSPCLLPAAAGNDYVCPGAVQERLGLADTGACLTLELDGDGTPQRRSLPLQLQVDDDGGWRLHALGGPTELEVQDGQLATLRLFLLQAGVQPAQACPGLAVDSPCDSAHSCLLAFGRAETPVAGDGTLALRYGGEGRACAIECNDDCDPADGNCRRICFTEQAPAVELCDGRDNDCDGEIDEGFFLGQPCAGRGECPGGVVECDDEDPFHRLTRCSTAPGGSGHDALDPDRQERCDGLDNDCDGQTDDSPADEGPDHPCGSDVGECSPGYYVCGRGELTCAHIAQGASAEVCDGLDNDCDGETDEDFTAGELAIGSPCVGPGTCGAGTIRCHADDAQRACCSADPECGWAGPETAETCDGQDNDCDGETDEGYTIQDAGGERREVGQPCRGLGACDVGGLVVCLDAETGVCSTMPGGPDDRSATELCDGLDNDCDGSRDEDFRFQQPALGGAPAAELPVGANCELPGVCGRGLVECDAEDLLGQRTLCSSGPGGSSDRSGPEVCDGLDDDCNGQIPLVENDDDGDRYPACGEEPDCNDDDLAIHPRADERCNRKDDDCDGQTDESDPQGGGSCGSDVGECAGGTEHCRNGAVVCEGAVGPASETCNGKDDDCDGLTDEDFLFAQTAVGETPAGQLKVGALCEVAGRCGFGLVECDSHDAQHRRVICSSGPGGSRSRVLVEGCNGVDDDCDGAVDDGFNVGSACEPPGACTAGVLECATTSTTRCSTGPQGSASQAQAELCDRSDNDCDGLVDDGYGVGTVCGPFGECPAGRIECRPDKINTICSTAPGGSAYPSPAPTEDCNAKDDDCDGQTDEDVLDPCGHCGVGASCVTACGSAGQESCADIGEGPVDTCEPVSRLLAAADFTTCSTGFTRASIATVVVDAAGRVEQVAENQLRLQWDPVLQQRVYLQEEAGSNLLLWSSDLSRNPPWSTRLATVTLASDAGSPMAADGTASKLDLQATGSVSQTLTLPVAGRTFTLSFWARAGSLDRVGLELNNNVRLPGAPYPVTLTNQWQRYSYSFSFGAAAPDGTRILFRNPDAEIPGTIYLWGVQLEQAAYASSYIPSGGVPGSRAADRLAGRGELVRKVAGTWTAWIRPSFEFDESAASVSLMQIENIARVDYTYTAGEPAGRLRCTAPTGHVAELSMGVGSWFRGEWVLVGCAWDDAIGTATPGVQVFFWRGGELSQASNDVGLQITAGGAAPAVVRLAPSEALSRDVRLYQRRLSAVEVTAIRDATRASYGH